MAHNEQPPTVGRGRGLRGIDSCKRATNSPPRPTKQAPRLAQPIITVRADRNRVVVERAGAAPWKFPAAEALDAIEFARAAKLFGATLVIELDGSGR
jgi:hypothetical protein